MTFAQNLRYLREINQVTQKELASYLNVTRSTIAGYERKGKQPDYEKLLRIASYFHVSVDFLLNGIPEDHQLIPNYIVTRKIQDYEFTSAFRKLSPASRQRLWDYMELLQLSDQKERQTDPAADKADARGRRRL